MTVPHNRLVHDSELLFIYIYIPYYNVVSFREADVMVQLMLNMAAARLRNKV